MREGTKPQRGSDKTGKDKPSSNENFEESHPKRGRFELLVDDSEFFWYLEESKVDCANKYMEKFVSNWVLQKEITFLIMYQEMY